jgi:hypothetical protein
VQDSNTASQELAKQREKFKYAARDPMPKHPNGNKMKKISSNLQSDKNRRNWQTVDVIIKNSQTSTR